MLLMITLEKIIFQSYYLKDNGFCSWVLIYKNAVNVSNNADGECLYVQLFYQSYRSRYSYCFSLHLMRRCTKYNDIAAKVSTVQDAFARRSFFCKAVAVCDISWAAICLGGWARDRVQWLGCCSGHLRSWSALLSLDRVALSYSLFGRLGKPVDHVHNMLKRFDVSLVNVRRKNT